MRVSIQQENEFNFSLSQIDQRQGCSGSLLDSSRTLALSRAATSHRHHFPMQEFKSSSQHNSKKRNPLVQKILANNASLSSFTLGYSKWMDAQATHKSIIHKTQQCKMKKDQKIVQLQHQIDNKVMSQCTFKPQTNKSKIKRSLNEFLESQNQHTKRVQQKRENLKKNLDKIYKESEPFRPVINKGKTKNNQTPVYDRLYQLRERDDQSAISDTSSVLNQTSNNSKPLINKKSQNMVRNVPVGQLLYQDAMRRNNAQKYTQVAKVRNQQQRKISKSKNDKFVAQKFIKEYYYCLQDLNLDEWKEQFTEQMFQDILRKLGFLSLGSFQDIVDQQHERVIKSEEQKLVEQAFEILKEFGVDSRNVCVFLMAVIGIYNINPVNFERARQPQSQQQQFNLDDVKGRKLQKYFLRFFHNRLSSEALKKTNYKDQNPYQPIINSESSQMAQKQREKMLQLASQVMNQNDIELVLPEDGSISHTDLLVIHKLAKEMELEKKRQYKSQLTDPQCTFKPNNEKKQNGTPRYGNQNFNAGVQKSYELYSQARNKNMVSDKNMNYTMARTVQSRSGNSSSVKHRDRRNLTDKLQNKSTKKSAVKVSNQLIQSNLFNARDVDKTLVRMYEARKKREHEKNWLERGYGNTAMNNTLKNFSKNTKNYVQSTGQTSAKSSAFKNNQAFITNNLKQFRTPQFDQGNLKQEMHALVDRKGSFPNKFCNTLNNRIEQIQKQHELSNQKIEKMKNGTQRSENMPKISRDEQGEQDFDEQPLLVIDVNMDEQQKQQIYIFKGDQQRLQELVQQFCQKHGLDEDSKEQLMEMVSSEVEQVLRSINT